MKDDRQSYCPIYTVHTTFSVYGFFSGALSMFFQCITLYKRQFFTNIEIKNIKLILVLLASRGRKAVYTMKYITIIDFIV